MGMPYLGSQLDAANNLGSHGTRVKDARWGSKADLQPPDVKDLEVSGLNTFGQQLAVSAFLRAAMTGFSVEGMYEQYRMPEILCDPQKMRCYGARLRTGKAKKAKAHSVPRRDSIIWNSNFDLGMFVSVDEDFKEYGVDQCCPLQMLNVPQASVKSIHTLSLSHHPTT